jgi:hypothetical protein
MAMSHGAAGQALRIRQKFCARRWIAYTAGCPQSLDRSYVPDAQVRYTERWRVPLDIDVISPASVAARRVPMV